MVLNLPPLQNDIYEKAIKASTRFLWLPAVRSATPNLHQMRFDQLKGGKATEWSHVGIRRAATENIAIGSALL